MQSKTTRLSRFLGFAAVLGACALTVLGVGAQAQQPQYPKPADLPNPYRLVAGWPTLPTSMNGGHWGEVSRVRVDAKGNVWVFHRCFAVAPPRCAATDSSRRSARCTEPMSVGADVRVAVAMGHPHGW